MWALGCIHAELILLVPFLQGGKEGEGEIAQLEKIFEVLGSCTCENGTLPRKKLRAHTKNVLVNVLVCMFQYILLAFASRAGAPAPSLR